MCDYDDLYFNQLEHQVGWKDYARAGFQEVGKGIPSRDPVADSLASAGKALVDALNNAI